MARLFSLLLLAALSLGAVAKDAAPAAADPQVEARMLRIAAELRCLVCQNETVAGSSAALAEDLREQVRVMLRDGRSDEQIVAYMTERYGDFIRYRPPLKATTLLLWFGPALLLTGGVTVLMRVLRRRARLTEDDFETEAPDAAEQA